MYTNEPAFASSPHKSAGGSRKYEADHPMVAFPSLHEAGALN